MQEPVHTPSIDELLEQTDWIHALARRFVPDDPTAQDITQEALLAGLREAPPSPRLRPWLRTVVRNLVRRRDGAERARAQREQRHARPENPSTTDNPRLEELRRLLVEELLELPEPYRTVLLERFFLERGYEEMAGRRGVPVETMRTQVARGVQRLRRRLQPRRPDWARSLLGGGLLRRLVLRSAWLLGGAAAAGALVLWATRQRQEAEPGAGLRFAPAPVETASGPRSPEAPGRAPGGGELAASEPTWTPMGQVQDLSGHPVPWIELELQAADGTQTRVRSDWEGRWTSEVPFPTGALEVRSLEEGAPLAGSGHLLIRDGEGSLALRVDAGPTYLFAEALPGDDGPSRWLASLRTEMHEQTLRGVQPHYPEFPRLQAGFDGAGPWVRFPLAFLRTVGSGPTWILEVAHDDGSWYASRSVEPTAGRHGPLQLAPVPTASVDGRVLDEWGEVPGYAMVRFEREGVLWTSVAGPEGDFRLRGLVPGRYDVWIWASGCEDGRTEVDITAGERAEPRLRVNRLPVVGGITGRITSSTGDYDEAVQLRLRHRTRRAEFRHLPVVWTGAAGERRASFAFEELPAGPYRLEIRSDDHLPWVGAEGNLEAGAELNLVCMDGVLRHDVRLYAVDAATGRPLERVNTGVRLTDSVQVTPWAVTDLAPGETLLRGVPVDRGFRFGVRAPGYAPVFGDQRDVQLQDGEAVLRVSLQRGWGLRIYAYEKTPEYQPGPERQAVVGAQILADGVPVGRLDEAGELLLILDQRPEKLGFEHPRWEAIDSFHFTPGTGAFRDANWHSLVIFAVRKP